MSGADSEGPIGTRDRIHQRTCCARGSSTAPAAISREYPREYPVLVSSLIDSKRYKMRLTHQVCGQHGRYWPIISSRVMCGPVPYRGTAWFPRRWSSGAVDVVIIVRSREQSACISALDIECKTPRIGPAPAAATGSSITRAEHVNPAPLQPHPGPPACSQRRSLDPVVRSRAGSCDATEGQDSRHSVPVTC